MGTFTVHFKFTEDEHQLLDFLIGWYVQRGMDCTAGVGGDGTGSADIDPKYLADFCMIEKICVTAVKWDKDGITAWRPKRKKVGKPVQRVALQRRQPTMRAKQSHARKSSKNGLARHRKRVVAST